MGTSDSLGLFAPEIFLSATVLALIGVDLATTRAGRGGRGSALVAVAGSAFAVLAAIGHAGAVPTWLFGRMVVFDPFSSFFKVLLGLSLVAACWMSMTSREVAGRPNEGEYYTLLVSSGLGMLLMAGAGNLLMAYLSLEFVSLTSYVLTGFLRHNRRSGEAALKYLIYGGVASGTMIYGMSWVFGLTGTMDYAGIASALASLDAASRPALFVALVLVLTGFGYKIAAVPFHMWAPDVYTGAPIPVTAFLAVGSKAAGFALLLRFFHFGVTATGPSPALGGTPVVAVLWFLCFLTMTLGNLAAVSQTNMKRLLAYSSIAHAGYALLGVVVLRESGLQAVLLYLAIYYLMNLGAFWVLMIVVNETGREDLDAFRGLAWRGGGALAVTLGVFLFSLAGLPPLAGFVGKFYVFAAAVQGELYGLVVVGVLTSVVSLYYYARVVKAMFLDDPLPGDAPMRVGALDLLPVGALALVTTAFLVFGYGWLLDRVAQAGRILL
jgi:NADH-quinone oxidoreductase subunit N